MIIEHEDSENDGDKAGKEKDDIEKLKDKKEELKQKRQERDKAHENREVCKAVNVKSLSFFFVVKISS